MSDFIAHFVRASDGSWICVSAASLRLDNGEIRATPGDRFRPGDIVLGLDVARALDYQESKSAQERKTAES